MSEEKKKPTPLDDCAVIMTGFALMGLLAGGAREDDQTVHSAVILGELAAKTLDGRGRLGEQEE